MSDYIIEEFYEEMKNVKFEAYGILDSNNKIHTLGTDSKIIGRIFEMFAQPILEKIAERHGMILTTPESQTVYPDFIMMSNKSSKEKIAIDIKTTYVDSDQSTIKFTLGSYGSYMRNNTKNIEYKYTDYSKHYVIGFVYDRLNDEDDGRVIPYSKEGLEAISCPYGNVRVWVQEKYKITGLTEKSGNTTNIGSITSRNMEDYINGNGPFSALDKQICDDYWRNYKKETSYRTIEDYFAWARVNSKLAVDWEAQEEIYLQWRKINCPSGEDLLLMALRVLHARGPRGAEKGLLAEFENEEICVASKEPRISEYTLFCNKNDIEIIEVIR